MWITLRDRAHTAHLLFDGGRDGVYCGRSINDVTEADASLPRCERCLPAWALVEGIRLGLAESAADAQAPLFGGAR